jgi:hypothetical protein
MREETGRAGRSVSLAVAFLMLAMPPAFGFDDARYHTADLDQLLAQRRPRSGVDLYPALALKVTRCIEVRSAKGKELQLFIQDEVASFLPKEAPLDSKEWSRYRAVDPQTFDLDGFGGGAAR